MGIDSNDQTPTVPNERMPGPTTTEQAPFGAVAAETALSASTPPATALPAGKQPRRGPSLWRPAMLLAFITVLIVGGSLHRAGSTPQPLAAVVNGLPVPMADYERQLRFATKGYIGPRAAPDSPTGRTIDRLLRNRAVQEAIAAVLIDHTASQHQVSASDGAIAAETARMSRVAGGDAALQRQMQATGMTADDVRWVAKYNVLRTQLAALLHDNAWLDQLVAKASITYYVSDGAVGADLVPAMSMGHPAPPFVGIDLKGHAVSLADLQGRPVVLNFWATWCGYCRDEMPMLLRFAHAHRDLTVVSLNQQEDPETVRRYIHQHHLQGLTVWLDRTGDASADYNVSSLPITIFIDRQGIIRSYTYGPLANTDTLLKQAEHAEQGTNNSG